MKLKTMLFAALAVLTIYSCKKDEKVSIFSFSKPTSLISGFNGGTDSFKITGDGDWAITRGTDSWIKEITPMSGKGNATITITADKNNTDKARTEIIKVNGFPFQVSQTAPLEIGSVIGVWNGTDAKGSKYKFTFNEDMTCKSEMSRGTYDGKYSVDSPLINIMVTKPPMPIQVWVKSYEPNKMNAFVFGVTLELIKE